MKKLVVILMGLILFIACVESTINKEKLKEAEILMQDYPDSALKVLRCIDTANIKTERGRALYLLLLSQAYEKNYIELQSDSIIRPAVNYFADSDGDDRYYEMLSLYYLSRIYYNCNNFAECVITNLRAEEIAKELNDNFYLGMIYGTISDVYIDVHNATEGQKYAELSYKNFKIVGREPYIKYAYLALAVAANNNHQWQVADQILTKLYKSRKWAEDTLFIATVLEKQAHLYLNINENLKSKDKLLELNTKYSNFISGSSYAKLAYIYAKENKLDSAQYWIEKANNCIYYAQDSAMYQCALIEILTHKKLYNEALNNKYKLDKIQENAIYEVWQQPIIRSQSEYFRRNLELTKKLSRRYNYIFLVVFISVIILSISTVVIVRQHAKIRRIKLENEIKAQEIKLKSIEMSMAEEIDTAKEVIIALRERLKNEELAQTKIKAFFYDQFDILRKFCESSYSIVREVKNVTINKSLYKPHAKTINDLPQNYVYEFGNNQEVLEKIEEILNITNNEIMIKLRSQLPDLKEDNIRLLMYFYAGFPNRAISIFMKMDIDNVYRRKYKMKEYINKSSAPDKDLFVSSL